MANHLTIRRKLVFLAVLFAATACSNGRKEAKPGNQTGVGGTVPTAPMPTVTGAQDMLLPGNREGKCSEPLPDDAKIADTSKPTTVVGNGTPESCTFQALQAAVGTGGVITFQCGNSAVTIPVTTTLELPTDKDTIIDGGLKVTLDGQGKVRILHWGGTDWMKSDKRLTLQRLALINGKAPATDLIPTHPEPCAQGYNDGQGGALLMRDGVLRVVEVTFENNRGAELGPDTGGGALYVMGSKPAIIVRSTFRRNAASNAGAMGMLFAEANIYDSLFEGNEALGHGANADQPDKCPFINAGHHQTGSGGNGGALYSDGVGVSMSICGTKITQNRAKEFGAAIFFTSNDGSNKGSLIIRDSNIVDNRGNGYWEDGGPGISTNANVVPPVNSTINR